MRLFSFANRFLHFAYCALLIAFCLLLTISSCHEKNEPQQTSAATSDLYTCSMHPQILENHPGDCPICGMKLIKKNATPVALTNIDLETLVKPTNEFVVASLPVTTPQQSNINIPIKVYGTIESDTIAVVSVSGIILTLSPFFITDC